MIARRGALVAGAAQILLVTACSPRARPQATASSSAAPDANVEADAAAAPLPPEIEALVVSGISDGLRERARGVLVLPSAPAAPSSELVLLERASEDTCVRVGFSAGAPVTPDLQDGRGRSLSASAPRREGALGDGGPVCLRRGDTLRLRVEGAAGTRVSWVLWSAP